MLKRKTKFIIIVAIITFAICLFNTNTVNAKNEEQAQQLFDVIPESISIDIPEIEYEKADKLIEQKIKELCRENNISTAEVNFSVYGTQLYYLDIHTARIDIKGFNTGVKTKKISVVYNNTHKKNSADKEYVKNLTSKLKSPRYYEVDLDFYSDKTGFDNAWNNYLKMITDEYTKQVNDNSISVKATSGAGGTDGGINVYTWESGTVIGVFKNEILYDIKKMGSELTVPVINIPNTVAKDKINDYVISLIKKNHKEFGEHIDRIEKGTKNMDETYPLDIDIPNGYTVYSMNMPSYVIINMEDNKNSIIITDDSTNIKIETDTDTVPENTKLVVNEIKQGEKYNNIEKILKNSVNKMYIYDTSLQNNGVEVQPNGKLKISIPIPNDLDVSNIVVYRITEDGTKTECLATIENGYAIIETDSMGIYVLGEKTNVVTGATENEKDDTPKTGTTSNAVFLSIILSLSAITLLSVKKYNAKH